MMVNQEAGKFSIWQANTGSKTSDIVAVDKQNNMVGGFCADSADGSSSVVSLPTSSASIPTSSSGIPPLQNEGKKLSAAVIGGIVAGAVGGVAILGMIGFLLRRRRMSGGGAVGTPRESELQGKDVNLPPYSVMGAGAQELPGYQYSAAELDSKPVTRSRF